MISSVGFIVKIKPEEMAGIFPDLTYILFIKNVTELEKFAALCYHGQKSGIDAHSKCLLKQESPTMR